MKYLSLFSLASLLSTCVFSQIEHTTTPLQNKGNKSFKVFPSGTTYTLETGTQPFYPRLMRQKSVIGHPVGTIGVGISQQYKPNPNEFRWLNPGPMLPKKGMPQHPHYGLSGASPVMSFTSPNARVHSFSAGRLNQGGFVPTYREFKVVQGFKLD
jgi:hypothetical protein